MGDTTKMVIGLVMIAVAMIVFPIVLTGADTILAHTSLADFTGLETLVQISPLLIFIGFLAGGGILTFSGVKGKVSSGRSRKRNYR